MVITACLAWYAETPATLERCARSLGGVCDYLVALGGRWDGFPPLASDRPDEQVAALEAGCDQAGIFCSATWTAYEWTSQVSKRAELMQIARQDSDWLFVIDADEFIVDADSQELALVLGETSADVAQIAGIRVPVTASSARRPWRRIYRASTGVTVRHAHNGYITADGRWLYGNPGHVTLEPVLDLTKQVLVAHDIAARTDPRKQARVAYNIHRRDADTERWPEPAVVA